MADATEHARSRLSRAGVLARSAILLLVLIWLAHYAYVRLTTHPPGPGVYAREHQPLVDIPKERDVTTELNALLGALPDYPYSPFHPTIGLDSPWDPVRHPVLSDVARYLALPGTERVLDGLRHIAHGSYSSTIHGLPDTSRAVELLVVRARVRAEHQGDFAGAIDDLTTAYHLARMDYEQPILAGLMRGATNDALIAEEVQRLAGNAELPLSFKERLEEELRAVDLPDRPAIHPWLVGERVWWQAYIDACYTKDEHGDGWYALGTGLGTSQRSVPRPDELTPGHAWLNLLSPLFHSRREVEVLADQHLARLARLDATQARTARDVAERIDRNPDVTLLDGPLARVLPSPGRTYLRAVYALLARQGAMTVLAIERYRPDHDGRPPGTLAELVPRYLESMPRDWYSDGPISYRPEGHSYVLYSLGYDGKDDGVRPGGRAPMAMWPNPGGDIVLSHVSRDWGPFGRRERAMLTARTTAVWPDENSEEESGGADAVESQ